MGKADDDHYQESTASSLTCSQQVNPIKVDIIRGGIMHKSRLFEERVLSILSEGKVGCKDFEICRQRTIIFPA